MEICRSFWRLFEDSLHSMFLCRCPRQFHVHILLGDYSWQSSPSSSTLILYARLMMRRIVFWWCPFVRVSILQSVFCLLFSYMLRCIELKLCIWFHSYACKILKFEEHRILTILAGVSSFRNLKYWKCSFPHFSFSFFDILSWNFYMAFYELQNKFEYCQFAIIFVGVMPLLELIILELQFSWLSFYILSHTELKICIWLFFLWTGDQVWLS